jgi:hypothetical protein
MSAVESTQERELVAEQMLQRLAAGDSAGAIGLANAIPDSGLAAAVYALTVRRVYRERHDVKMMLVVARAGIEHHLRAAKGLSDRQASDAMVVAARSLSFNAAANCWPGWGDDGIVLDAADVREGLELATLSLTLVHKLELAGQPLGTAFWLVGALQLALDRIEASLSSFAKARAAYAAGDLPLQVMLVDGYRIIAERRSAPAGSADRELARVVDGLRAEGSKAALGFADQLNAAARHLASWLPAKPAS